MKTPPLPGKLIAILVAVGLFGWVVYVSGYFQPGTGDDTDGQPPTEENAADALVNAFSRADWPHVESACRVLLNQDPFHAEARFNLGFSLFRQERLDEAAEHYLQAKDFLEYRDYSLFNLACIFARQNKLDLAVENLKLSLENGFTSNRGISNNQDLINLREHSMFKTLVDMENENRGTRNKVQGN